MLSLFHFSLHFHDVFSFTPVASPAQPALHMPAPPSQGHPRGRARVLVRASLRVVSTFRGCIRPESAPSWTGVARVGPPGLSCSHVPSTPISSCSKALSLLRPQGLAPSAHLSVPPHLPEKMGATPAHWTHQDFTEAQQAGLREDLSAPQPCEKHSVKEFEKCVSFQHLETAIPF